MNGSDNFAGIFGPMTAGFLVATTSSWALPFLVSAGLAAVSFVVFFFFVVPEPIQISESNLGSSTASVT
jgi:MFS family permease